MSSHHVIRDGQEPPVFLLNEASVLHPLLGDLLEWSPITICMDKAVPALIGQGYKADHILCQNSTPKQWQFVFDQHYAVSVVKVSNWHDVVDKVQAILDENAADFLHVMVGNQDSKKPFEVFEKVVIYGEDVKWTWFSQGKFRKWLKAGSMVLLDGAYTEMSGNYSQQGDVIETAADGIIEINGLINSWIGEVF